MFSGSIDKDEPAPISVYNDRVGDQLIYGGEVELASDGRYLARTTHFSNWFFLDWGNLLARGKELVAAFFGPQSSANITCSDTATAQDLGYTATLYGSTSYKWCMGMESGAPVLKLGNPNRYPVKVESTPNMVLTNQDQSLTSLIPQLFSTLSEPPSKPGNSVYLLAAGSSYTFKITSKTEQGVRAQPSHAGFFAAGLLFGLETLELVFGEGKAKKLFQAMSAVDCAAGFGSMAGANIGDAGAAADYMTSAIQTVVVDCLDDAIKKAFGAEGVAGVALVTGVSWLLSGISTLVTGASAQIESIANPDGATVVVQGKLDTWMIDRFGVGPVRLGDSMDDATQHLSDFQIPDSICEAPFGFAPSGAKVSLLDDVDGNVSAIFVFGDPADEFIVLDGLERVFAATEDELSALPGFTEVFDDVYWNGADAHDGSIVIHDNRPFGYGINITLGLEPTSDC